MRSTLLAGLLLTGAMIAPASASTVGAPLAQRYAMPQTQMWDMTSDKGETYRIFVAYPDPKIEMPANGWPVLYVLDGNAYFGLFAETRRLEEYAGRGKLLIVGVGYPNDNAYDYRRLNDLTAPMPASPPPSYAHLAKYKSGGQDIFLDFLTGKLRTEIGKRFKVDASRQSLFGHSLGGLFATHVLFTRPQAFRALVAASPSTEWNDQQSLAEERDFAARLAAGKIGKTTRLLVTVGGRDVDDDPYMGEAFARRMQELSRYGLSTRFRRYEDEGHMGVPPVSLTETLRFIAEGY